MRKDGGIAWYIKHFYNPSEVIRKPLLYPTELRGQQLQISQIILIIERLHERVFKKLANH